MNSFFKHIRFLGKGYEKPILFAIFLTIFLEAFKLISPYLVKIIIDEITTFDDSKVRFIFTLVLLLIGAEVFVSIYRYFVNRVNQTIKLDVEADLSVKAEQKLISLSLGYHEKEDTGNKVTKIQRGLDGARNVILALLWDIVPTIFQLLLSTIILLYINIYLGITFLLVIPLFMYISIKMHNTVSPLWKKYNKAHEKASGLLGQSILNIFTVQSYAAVDFETDKYAKVRRDILKQGRHLWIGIFEKFTAVKDVIADVGMAIIILVGVYLILEGNITVGTLVFAITISQKAFSSLWRMSHIYDRMIDNLSVVSRLLDIFEVSNPVQEASEPVTINSLRSPITFKNVSFDYGDGNDSEILNGVNFTIEPGESVALVGPSGSGKSTIVKLLFRHYDPTGGSIQVGGHDLKDLKLDAYRKHLAIVPQDVDIFNGTVEENIKYGTSRATKNELINAAKAAHADDFINGFTKKYKTIVGERGVKLSGGQKQRLGIARAILRAPDLLVFDEATSNLDSYSEKMIQDALSDLYKKQTMLIIAHRLSTIKKCDKIIVIENGRVVEAGSHAQLKKNKGLYARLLTLQEGGQL